MNDHYPLPPVRERFGQPAYSNNILAEAATASEDRGLTVADDLIGDLKVTLPYDRHELPSHITELAFDLLLQIQLVKSIVG
ncbi:hypothetical protein [Mycolicibacterium gadium]|uniref:Uncharacterized protein n=1 Tax=Mycolicibacterium gadium TaxID=1794 RepID=A0ABT6GIE5_MYCGU|nr:hypothetical protein [Mycolicibacterium gadium]MDG5481191.1 hypothetical protein [Mycolicibacterium gadium]